MRDGVDVCVTVTLLDALVLARSVFHPSMNYRSVVILARARFVSDDAEKLRGLEAITEHLVPGRWADARQPSAKELKQTYVLAIPITEASAKIRSGPPKDDEADLGLPVWGGVVPLPVTPGPPLADELVPAGADPPGYLRPYRRPRD